MFGYPIFMGAEVIACVTVGDRASLRFGKITEYNPKDQSIKITGGNCKKGLWRNPSEIAVLMLPGEMHDR